MSTSPLPYTAEKRAAMRRVFAALRRSGGRGMTRAELCAATALSLWQVREAVTTMTRAHWLFAASQVVNGRATWRYATHPKWWHKEKV